MQLIINEHPSSSYAPRTYHNAHSAELTIAFAVDFKTAGEKLTKKAALTKGNLAYLPIDINSDSIQAGRALYVACKRPEKLPEPYRVNTLNVAGNGAYTLVKCGFNQSQINRYIYDVISMVHAHHPFTKIISGGQTGIDIAGAIAGVALGIPVELTYPKGLKIRNLKNQDIDQKEDEIRHFVEMCKDRIISDVTLETLETLNTLSIPSR